MEELLNWFKYWLPLIQGFAAIASIGGAILSWKYALKAQKARAEMTQNIISARLLSQFDEVLMKLRVFQEESLNEDGKADFMKYQRAQQQNMHLIENTLAKARAAVPYLRTKPHSWDDLLNKLIESSIQPSSRDINYLCKYLALVIEQLRTAASTRELGSNHDYA